MARMKTTYCIDSAEFEFEDGICRDKFLLDPRFKFDFCIDNVDDKKGVYRMFGTTDVSPEYPTGEPKFTVTYAEASEDEETVAEVSVELEMAFNLEVPFEEFCEWVDGEGESWRYTGRIECVGEVSLRSSEREEYESFEEIS